MADRKNEAIWIENRNRWQINVQQDGARKTFVSSKPGKKGKIEAEKKADHWLATRTTMGNVRFGTIWPEFLEEMQTLTSNSNYKQHEHNGRLHVLPIMKNKRLDSITDSDWQACINTAYRKGLAKKTLQNIRGTISVFCRYARKRGFRLIPEDIVIPKNAPSAEKKTLQPYQIKTLFTENTTIWRSKEQSAFFIHAWRFLVLTGLRRGELCGLRHEDREGNTIHIRRSINYLQEETEGKTAKARRSFYLTTLAQKVLDDQREMLRTLNIKSPWIFCDEYGQRLDPNHLYKKWLNYSRQHGIDCSLHELRHTMISLAKADVPPELLKQAVGHSDSMNTFGVYGHQIDGEMQRVATILDNIFQEVIY